MKILEIRQADFNIKKYITSEIEIIKSLNKLGHTSHLFGIGNNDEDNEKFVTLFKAPFGHASLFQLKMMYYLIFYVLRNKTDILIIDDMSVFSSLFILVMRPFYKIKMILDIRTIPVENISSYKKYRFLLSCKFASIFFDGASFITVGTREYIKREYKLNFKNSVCWSSGVNIERFDSAKCLGKNKEIIDDLKKNFVLFYHGSISKNRGINLVLEAINELKNDIPELLFLSLSNNNEYIKNYCIKNNLKIKENLLLIDAIPYNKVPEYIFLADICIIPLPKIIWWEISSPLKLMEYLAMSKPLILTDIQAHREVVGKKSNFSVFIDNFDKNSFVKAIKYSFDNINQLKKNAREGRKLVREKYTWRKQAEKLLKMLKEIYDEEKRKNNFRETKNL